LANRITVEGLRAGYGSVQVLEGLSLRVDDGETVALLGTNGNGKSTLMKSIMGIVKPTAGSVVAEIDGRKHDLVGREPEEIVELGAFIGFNIGYHTFFGTLKFYPMFAPDGRLVSQEESARIYGAAPASLAGVTK